MKSQLPKEIRESVLWRVVETGSIMLHGSPTHYNQDVRKHLEEAHQGKLDVHDIAELGNISIGDHDPRFDVFVYGYPAVYVNVECVHGVEYVFERERTKVEDLVLEVFNEKN